MLERFVVHEPEQHTLLVDFVEDGVWAYIEEIPTTRTFGATEQEARVKLVMLIMESLN